MELAIEQKVFIGLILRSQHTWTTDHLEIMSKAIEKYDLVKDQPNLEQILSAHGYSLYCINCGTQICSLGQAYPTSLMQCDACVFHKPLKWKNQYILPGEAKLNYVDASFWKVTQ